MIRSGAAEVVVQEVTNLGGKRLGLCIHLHILEHESHEWGPRFIATCVGGIELMKLGTEC